MTENNAPAPSEGPIEAPKNVFDPTPRYAILPASQDQKLDGDLVIGWTLRYTMTSEGVTHTVTEEFDFPEGQSIGRSDPEINVVLAHIAVGVANSRGTLARCADELEAKISTLKGTQT